MKSYTLLILVIFSFLFLFRIQLTADNAVFIENKGQWPDNVKFLAMTGGVRAWLTENAVVYDHFKIKSEGENSKISGNVIKQEALGQSTPNNFNERLKSNSRYNFFIGNNPDKWVSNAAAYKEIVRKDFIEGVDVRYYFQDNSLRYDYIVNPGANLSELNIKFTGADEQYIDENGQIVLKTSIGEIKHSDIFAYQKINGEIEEVKCDISINETNEISFNADYDKSRQLIIDPLIFFTYLGTEKNDDLFDMATDSDNRAVLLCQANYENYPVTVGPYQTEETGKAACITKFASDGASLIFSTYIGGNKSEDPRGIAIDSDDNIYISGHTESDNYPITNGAYQSEAEPVDDIILTKFTNDASSLLFSTYIAANGYDRCFDIFVDENDKIYLTGSTNSKDFPLSANAFQKEINGNGDAFILIMNSAGNAIINSTLIGGDAFYRDHPEAITVDNSGNIYIAGDTESSNYPVTANAFKKTMDDGTYGDCFISKLNPDLSQLLYSTFIGGYEDTRSNETIYSIHIDEEGCLYAAGWTDSDDFPTTEGAFKREFSGHSSFVLKMNNDGTDLIFSTFIAEGEATDMKIGENGSIFLTGYADGDDFPVTAEAIQQERGSKKDVFIARLNPDATDVLYGSYYGGYWRDEGKRIAVINNNNVYVSGETENKELATDGANDTEYGGGNGDAFLMKVQLPDVYLGDEKLIELKVLLDGLWKNNSHAPAPISLELRSGDELINSTLTSVKTATCGTDGIRIFDFTDIPDGDYWLVVRAAGYLALASSDRIHLTRGLIPYDFTDSPAKAAGGENAVHIQDGLMFMRAADYNWDMKTNADDGIIFIRNNGKALNEIVPEP